MQTSASNEFREWTITQPVIGPTTFTLFCFPYAGAGATVFHGWSRELPEGVAVQAVRLSGREGRMRERPYTDMTALVATLVRILGPELRGPYGFFGHSMGARISLELTRALVAAGYPAPAHLWASGARAPQLPRRPPVHELPDDELLAELRRLHELPDEIFENPELREIFLPILRADFELHDSHVHVDAPPLPVPISAYGGTDDPLVPVEDLPAWAVHTRAAFQVHTFPGRHLFLRTARAALLECLSDELSLWLTSPT